VKLRQKPHIFLFPAVREVSEKLNQSEKTAPRLLITAFIGFSCLKSKSSIKKTSAPEELRCAVLLLRGEPHQIQSEYFQEYFSIRNSNCILMTIICQAERILENTVKNYWKALKLGKFIIRIGLVL
jgi:hypothetical protein